MSPARADVVAAIAALAGGLCLEVIHPAHGDAATIALLGVAAVCSAAAAYSRVGGRRALQLEWTRGLALLALFASIFSAGIGYAADSIHAARHGGDMTRTALGYGLGAAGPAIGLLASLVARLPWFRRP